MIVDYLILKFDNQYAFKKFTIKYTEKFCKKLIFNDNFQLIRLIVALRIPLQPFL